MLNAKSFVIRSQENILFNICIDNEWYDGCTREKAFELIREYENKYKFEPWIGEVMNWFISNVDENTVVMEIL